jgi:lipopolysaccharide/colanic/teichoic acid biosynthesis glycosyltransferase
MSLHSTHSAAVAPPSDGQDHRDHGPRVISQDLFTTALIAERKRADRSNRPLGLLIVSTRGLPAASASSIWAEAIVAIASSVRPGDTVGWSASRVAIGVILPELRAAAPVAARDMEARIRRTLDQALAPETGRKFSVQFHVHSAMTPAQHDRPVPVDLLLFPELGWRDDRQTVKRTIKRGLDVIGSLSLLILLSPLFLLIAAVLKLRSPGPVFYEQTRIGEMMKPFTMLKFRTMHVNADHRVHQDYVSWFIKASARAGEPASNGVFKLTSDPRITPVGRILRSTSLDELPQLWNVLRGDMSLVGPRPPLPYELEQYKPWHCRRVLEAKPGITGLWQVGGRSRTTFDEMVRLDLRYAKTCSLWTDLKILLATPRAVISGKGAC